MGTRGICTGYQASGNGWSSGICADTWLAPRSCVRLGTADDDTGLERLEWQTEQVRQQRRRKTKQGEDGE